MDQAHPPLIPSYGFDLAAVSPRDRVDAYTDAFGQQYDIRDLPPALDARGQGFDLGRATLVDSTYPDFSITRDSARTRRDGVDKIIVSLEVAGGFRVLTDEKEDEVEPGRVTIYDIARPLVKQARAGRTVVLALERELVDEMLPGVDVHGLTLGGGGWLLAEHLRALRTHLPLTPAQAAPHLLASTVQMMAACVLPTADRLDRARPALSAALLARAKRYIRDQVRSPDLTPERIAAAVGASRSSLYRAFEPSGGVASFIRQTRLEAARAALSDPADPRRIGDIAFDYGFGSEAQFSRAIRAAFGVAPSELRRAPDRWAGSFATETWLMRGWGPQLGGATAPTGEGGGEAVPPRATFEPAVSPPVRPEPAGLRRA